MEKPIEKAARLAGNKTALAKKVGVTPQAVQQWVKAGKPPIGRCPAIEQAVFGAVTRYELRPDIFGIDLKKNG